MSVKRFNFALVFFKVVCYANPGDERNFAISSSFIFRHMFLKISNTSANNNPLLWIYKSQYSPKVFISKSLQTLFVCL